jgi:hypothetical protein
LILPKLTPHTLHFTANHVAESGDLRRRAVAAQLGIARSSAGRLRQKAQEDGLLDSDDESEAGDSEDESGTLNKLQSSSFAARGLPPSRRQ